MKRFLPYIGPLIGLTGVSLALYFHGQSVQERVPTFYVGPQRAVIVDARGPTSSDLQVLYHGRRLETSVAAVTLYVWNDGRLPIRADDVLGDPVSIELPPEAEILEARVIRTSRTVCGIHLGGMREGAKNSIPISFNILERDDGAAIQLIYTGSPDASIGVAGTIVGAGSPRLLKHDVRFTTALPPLRRRRIDRLMGWTTIALGLVALAVGIARWLRPAKQAPKPILSRRAIAAALVLTGLAYVGTGGYFVYAAHKAAFPGVPPSIWTEG